MLQSLIIVALVTALTAILVLRRRPGAMTSVGRGTSSFGGPIAASLAVVATALVIVGIVSNTLLRHLIQIAPAVVALGLLARRSDWGISAAATLFAFWFLIMGAIWLFLLGVPRIFTGTFTPVEIALTIIIGVASLLGLIAVYRRRTTIPIVTQLATIVVFTVLQFAAMWLSVQPAVARR